MDRRGRSERRSRVACDVKVGVTNQGYVGILAKCARERKFKVAPRIIYSK
ncbi:hypothetical protein QP256_03820 [Aerococcus sp. UMB8487]|nr:hypothetical protein [Aerococcus sp. UMB8487]